MQSKGSNGYKGYFPKKQPLTLLLNKDGVSLACRF
jgi:hypothetical protein